MSAASGIVTVGLNPAIDRVLEVKNFTLGAHQQGREVLRLPAGKSLNVSRALSRLGIANTATGFLGRDNRDEFLTVLEQLHVVDEFFLLPGRTRENVTIADPLARQETHIRQEGLHVAQQDLHRLHRKLQFLSHEGVIIVFSGSLPPGISHEQFAEVVSMCAEGGARVAVDTGGDVIRSLDIEKLWLVKPNRQELADLVGKDLTDERQEIAAAADLARGIDVVLLTRGAQGALMFTGSKVYKGYVGLDEDCVKNTVGCGDAMLGAFIAAHLKHHQPEQAFAQAIACATASACSMEPADFEIGLMDELEQKVVIEELA